MTDFVTVPAAAWLRAGLEAIHQADGAIIDIGRALDAFAGQARNRGADIHVGVAVTAIRPSEHSVEIEANAGLWSAEQAVACAGPRAPSLLETAGISPLLMATSQTICYFPYPVLPPPELIWYGNPDPYALSSPARGLKAARQRTRPGDRP